MSRPIQITVFTGFLGAGKTTTILSLLAQLPKDYKVVLLKNEFGDVQVDSQLAKQSSLAAVSEILNGCMCCILVGQMKTALLEIKSSFAPDRIIIEASGSAFPATLALQIRDLENETNGAFKLDSIVTVIDAENFTGYEDTSMTAKMQAAYTDVLLINKWELVTERQLDIVIDHLFTLNEATPKLKTSPKSGAVDASLVFGLDSQLFSASSSEAEKASWSSSNHHEEVETVTVRNGYQSANISAHAHVHDNNCDHQHTPNTGYAKYPNPSCLTTASLLQALDGLSKETVYRVKGFVRLKDPESRTEEKDASKSDIFIVNWAFGRLELTQFDVPHEVAPLAETEDILLTVMGERGDVRSKASKFAEGIGAWLS